MLCACNRILLPTNSPIRGRSSSVGVPHSSPDFGKGVSAPPFHGVPSPGTRPAHPLYVSAIPLCQSDAVQCKNRDYLNVFWWGLRRELASSAWHCQQRARHCSALLLGIESAEISAGRRMTKGRGGLRLTVGQKSV